MNVAYSRNFAIKFYREGGKTRMLPNVYPEINNFIQDQGMPLYNILRRLKYFLRFE